MTWSFPDPQGPGAKALRVYSLTNSAKFAHLQASWPSAIEPLEPPFSSREWQVSQFMRASVLLECKSWKDTDKRWQEQIGENLCRLENLPRQKSKSKPCKVPKQLQVRRVAPAPPAIQSDMHEICTTLPKSEQSSFALTCTDVPATVWTALNLY